MKVIDSNIIQDLKIIQPEVFHDFRGEYVETFNVDKYQFYDKSGKKIVFVEDDISVSRKSVLRGLHGDEKTWKLIQCLWGAFYYVVVDMRKDSPSYLKWESFNVNDKNRLQILVPAGCANGHLVLSDQCIFSYKQSEYYNGMEKQFTVRWDDPKLKIFWPEKNPILSLRDATAPYLGD
jgi:dTDP-4-dehydrorhamnose 3,5-epimerase